MKAKTSMIALACLSLLLLVANILLHVLPKNENSVQTQKKFVSSNQQRLSNMKLDRARFQLNKTSMEARKKRLPRVYCALPFTWRDHEPERGKQLSQMKFILKHWASRCDGVGFFIISKDPDVITEVTETSYGGSLFPGTKLRADVIAFHDTYRPDSLQNLIEKVVRMFGWLATNLALPSLKKRQQGVDISNDLEYFDWFIKVDHDSFFIAENFRKMVIEEDLDPSKLFYIGHSAHNSYDVQAHNLGCGYILSMAAMVKFDNDLTSRITTALDQKFIVEEKKERHLQNGPCTLFPCYTCEDAYVGRCLNELNIEVYYSRDSLGRERFLPFKLNTARKISHPKVGKVERFGKDWYFAGMEDGKWPDGSYAQSENDHLSPYPIILHGYRIENPKDRQEVADLYWQLYHVGIDLRFANSKQDDNVLLRFSSKQNSAPEARPQI